MLITKKSLMFLFSILFIISSAIVIADDLDVCIDTCKSNFKDEESRSPCIQGCKDKYGFDDIDFEMEKCQNECKTMYDNDEGTRKDCIEKCKANFGPKKVDPDFDVKPEIYEGEDIFEGYEDEELKEDAGTKPGSPFYFIDKFFDKFGDELSVKEEKIAEIKELIEAGDIETAKEVLQDYMELAEELEHEIEPERKEEAKKSAAAIRNAMKDIRDRLPPGEGGDFVSEIMSQEHSIATAAEISSKIKDLCVQLSELDPLEYSRMCRTDEEGPKWQKKMHKKLTKEQEKIAREFMGVMKQCFKSSGKDCECSKIPFPDFADACSEAAPLAVACEDGDDRACEKLEDLDMPKLPDYLQDIFDDMQGDMSEAKYGMHMPPECLEAGAKSPKDCNRIMIQKHAPEECKEALLEANVKSEKESRKICDRIMMEIHSPECVEKGIIDPDECAKQMMPPECEGMGPKECKDYLDNMRGEGMGPKIDFNCRKIEDPMERLECYDKASSQADSFKGIDDEGYEGPCMTDDDWKAKKAECREMYGESAGDEPVYGDSGEGWECVIDAKCIDFRQGGLSPEELKQKEKECADSCTDGRWDFSYGECKCYREGGPGEGCGAVDCKMGYHCEYGMCVPDEGLCDDCESKCPGASRTDCVNDRCECYYDYEDQCGECGNICGDLRWDCVNGRCECFDDYPDSGGSTDTGGTDTGGDPNYVDECDQCPEKCAGRGWDCSNGRCECLGSVSDSGDHVDECDTCADKCGERRWDCSSGSCECFDDGGDSGTDTTPDDTTPDTTPDDTTPDTTTDDTTTPDNTEQPSPPADDSGSDDGGSTDTTSDSSDSSSDSDSPDTSTDSGVSDITGGVIAGNAFLDYWFGH